MPSPRKAKPKKKAAPKKRAVSTKKTTSGKSSDYAYKKDMMRLRGELKKAYTKLEKDLKKHADPKTLQKDNNQLFLLLGEAHYLARTCYSKLHRKRK